MTNMRARIPLPLSGDDVIDVEVVGAGVDTIAMKEVGTTGPMVVDTMTGEAGDLIVAAAIEAMMIIKVEETGTMMTNMLEIDSTIEEWFVLFRKCSWLYCLQKDCHISIGKLQFRLDSACSRAQDHIIA